MVLCGLAFAEVNLNEVNFSNVTSGRLDFYLRRWFGITNTDITNAGDPFSNRGTGQVFYVDSAVGSDSFTGVTPALAKATIDGGINACTANRGDVVFVIQNHEETVDNGTSDAIDADVAGISIIGLGNGDDMPQILYDTTTDEFVVNADGVYISGLRFLAGVSEVANAIEIQAAGTNCTIVNCIFPEPTTSTWEFNIGIQMVTGGNYAIIAGNTFYSADAAGCESFLDGGAAAVVGYQILGNFIYGSFDAAAIFSDQVDLELLILDNVITNLETSDWAIELSDNATGTCKNNAFQTNAIATAIDNGALSCHGNTWISSQGTDMEAVEVNPIIDSTTNRLGFNDANNAYDSSTVVANENGSVLERQEFLRSQTVALLADLSNGGFDVGEIQYVDSVNASGTDGLTWATAELTLDAAVDNLSGDINEIIFIAANHNENLTGADAVDIDIQGVTIIGLGQGTERPRFDFDDAAAEIVIGAASVTIKNIQLMPGITEVLLGIDVENAGDYAVIENVSFIDGEAAGTDEFIDGIVVGTTATNVTVRNCDYTSTETSGENDTFVNLDAATIVNPTVEGCTVWADLAESGIWWGAAVPTDVIFRDNTITNLRTGEACIEGSGGATGVIHDNILASDTYGAILLHGNARVQGNTQTVAVSQAGIDVPLIPGQTYALSITLPDGDDDIFDVQGGAILITSFTGFVTETVAGAAETLTVSFDGVDDFLFSTAVDMTGIVRGSRIIFTNVNAAVLTPIELGAVGSSNLMSPWFCPVGMIEQVDGEDNAQNGIWTWHMTFIPLVDGVVVVPQ